MQSQTAITFYVLYDTIAIKQRGFLAGLVSLKGKKEWVSEEEETIPTFSKPKEEGK